MQFIRLFSHKRNLPLQKTSEFRKTWKTAKPFSSIQYFTFLLKYCKLIPFIKPIF